MNPANVHANASSSTTTAAQRLAKATPLLTCERCRDRKVKCDKLDPCTNCVVAGVICVATRRMRLPRGRHATPAVTSSGASAASGATVTANEDLCRRIRKLESTIERIRSWREGPSSATDSSLQASDGSPAELSAAPGPATSLPVQGPDDFWAYLVEEMHGLREVADLAAGNVEDEPGSGSGPEESTMAVDRGLALVGLRGLGPAGDLMGASSMDACMAAKLCQVYLRQVDPIIKILHRPSVSRWLLQDQAYLDYPPGHRATAALRGAIFYFAACSLSENQCRAELAMQRADLVAVCRSECETALEQSGLLTTRDITVLQAFILYLFARKIKDKSRAVWTLVALAVRVARALGLDQLKHPTETTFFIQQARRRLWATLCLLDMQAAQIQVTQPLIGSEGEPFAFVMPAHIDDADFGPDTVDPVPDKEGMTDMTTAHVTYRIQLLGRGMVAAATMATRAGTLPPRDSWQQQARQFEQQVLGLLHFCDPEASDLAWFTWHGTHNLVSAARLFALRPILAMQRMQGKTPAAAAEAAAATAMAATPTAFNQKTISQSLQLVVQALEKALLILADPRGEGFRWYIAIQWHMLMVAVSDCYLCADTELVRRSWPVVEEVYRRYEAHFERNNGGPLKRPLGQLMGRTRARVAALLGDSGGPMSVSVSSIQDAPPPIVPDAPFAMPTEAATYAPSLSTIASSTDADPLAGQNLWDIPGSGQHWEDLLSGMSFDSLDGDPSMYFLQ